MSAIEWTDETWNPVVGCTRTTRACDNCYAIKMANRQSGMKGRPQYQGVVAKGPNGLDWTGVINRAPDHIFFKPETVTRPTIWFVNSMSDVFHPNVPDDLIVDMFAVMNRTPRHTYQVLTKRPHLMVKKTRDLGLQWTDNIWAGSTMEDDKCVQIRQRHLVQVPAKVRFISAEPLMDDLPSLDLTNIHWLIVGGESGKGKTVQPLDIRHARSLRDRAAAAGIAFFFKQWGEFDDQGRKVGKDAAGRLLDGREHFAYPAGFIHPLLSGDKPVPATPEADLSDTKIAEIVKLFRGEFSPLTVRKLGTALLGSAIEAGE